MSSKGQIFDFAYLIETFGWTPDLGFVRVSRHLNRLEGAARRFQIPFNRAHIEQGLAQEVEGGLAAMRAARLRLRLYRSGNWTIDIDPMPAVPVQSWRLYPVGRPAGTPEISLRYKTSERQIYDRARAEAMAAGADEALLINEHGHVCEGSFTNLFVQRPDAMVTPDARCGLLPGILREELLENGRARVDIVRLDDLRDAQALFVGNSLRGLIPAELMNPL